MQLYKDYIKEREEMDILEKEYGFCTYKIINDYIYLADIYIKKDQRRKNLASLFINEVEEIGKLNKCNFILGGFCLDTNNWSTGKALLKNNGFIYFKKQKRTNMIYTVKEL